MKIKSILKYFIYVVLIFIMVTIREYVAYLFKTSYQIVFRASYCYEALSLLIGVSIGLVLGLEHFLGEFKKEGTWKLNLPKLIIVGLPSLYFSLTYIFYYSGIRFLFVIAYSISNYISRYGSGYMILFQLIFGYIVITSFYKSNNSI